MALRLNHLGPTDSFEGCFFIFVLFSDAARNVPTFLHPFPFGTPPDMGRVLLLYTVPLKGGRARSAEGVFGRRIAMRPKITFYLNGFIIHEWSVNHRD